MTTYDIARTLEKQFSSKYRRFSGFVNGGVLWDKCMEAINNPQLMTHIKFCNDVMKIPPVKTFLMAMHLTAEDFTKTDRQALGAIFGFIFKDIWKYSDQKRVSCRICGIQTASLFGRKEGE
ncbi:hypothetical protein [Megasphaera sueciensis]|jgi:hypothetical protein|uniref:hypothetical protein n=1 Tax=Megasphaera sueciensis TaxID=349094 RepID=UPI003D064DC4